MTAQPVSAVQSSDELTDDDGLMTVEVYPMEWSIPLAPVRSGLHVTARNR